MVKLSDCVDGSSFVILDRDDEEFFCAKDNLYGVKSHKLRLARQGGRIPNKAIDRIASAAPNRNKFQTFSKLELQQRLGIPVAKFGKIFGT